MTAAFLILGPIAIGYLTISLAEKRLPRKIWEWIFVPWIPIAVSTYIAALINLEGLICIVFALPITLTFASVGGIIAGLVAGRARKHGGLLSTCVAILPFILAPLEGQMNAPIQHRRVATEIRIDAPSGIT